MDEVRISIEPPEPPPPEYAPFSPQIVVGVFSPFAVMFPVMFNIPVILMKIKPPPNPPLEFEQSPPAPPEPYSSGRTAVPYAVPPALFEV